MWEDRKEREEVGITEANSIPEFLVLLLFYNIHEL